MACVAPFTLLSLVAAVFLTTPALAQAGSRYHSAKCLHLGLSCNDRLASYSGTCKAGIPRRDQSDVCIQSACRWCMLPGKASKYPCLGYFVRKNCDLDNSPEDKNEPMPTTPTVTPMPEPSMKPASSPMSNPGPLPPKSNPIMGEPTEGRQKPGACVWQGDDSATVNLDAVIPAKGWSVAERDGLTGLVYEKNKNMGIDQPGLGVMCFPVRVQQAGDYFLTAVSYAPHHTEHNDDWMAVSKELRLWRINGKKFFTKPPMTYLKAYQNNGIKGMSTEMKTKDHDGHRFIIMDVGAGEKFEVCMAGRSYRYEVYRLVMKKCGDGDECKGGNLENVMDVPLSQCVTEPGM